MAGIIGYGTYIPKSRIQQQEIAIPWGSWSAGEKSVCGIDEDVLTMAVEATRNAIKHSGINPEQIDAVYFGTASSPYAEQYLSPYIGKMLNLRPQATMIDYLGSVNALANAVLGCLDAIAAKRIKCGLVLGGEDRPTAPGSEGDVSFGAGAMAMIIGTTGTIVDIEGIETYATLFIDRWRATKDSWVSNQADNRFDREYGYQVHVAGACKTLLGKLGKQGKDYNYTVFSQSDDKIPTLPAKDLGISKDKMSPPLASVVGDLGCCSAFVSLAGILDKAKPGETILFASYGSGASNAMSLVVRNEIEQKRKQLVPLEKYVNNRQDINYVSYMKVKEHIKRAPY